MTASSLAKTVTLLNAIDMLNEAWIDVKQKTIIVNCFKKAGFVLATDNESDGDSDDTQAYDTGDLDDVTDMELPDAITLNDFREFVTMDQTAPAMACRPMTRSVRL